MSPSKDRKWANFLNKVETARFPFSSQQTLYLFRKELAVKEIAERRQIKESTVWSHLAMLIEYNQLSVWKILPKEVILKVLKNIKTENDRLTEIKERINDSSVSFNEIACILAYVRQKRRRSGAYSFKR